MLSEDLKARAYLKQKLKNASVGRIVIERPAKDARFTIYSSRPGVVIGKKSEGIDVLKSALSKIMGVPVHINIEEIRKPEIDPQLIADSIARQLETRIMFRRAVKRAMQNAMRLGALGIKIMSSGRLNGIEISRKEWYREGRVPLHTRRADIDYGTSEASTHNGIIGIKVWVYKGDHLAGSGAGGHERAAGRLQRFDLSLRAMRPAIAAPSGEDACPTCVDVTSLPAAGQNEVLRSLPVWVQQQQASKVRRLTLSLGGTDLTASELTRRVCESRPAPIDIAILAPALTFDATKAYSVVGRFASGAVRTLGTVEVRADGQGMLQPFGYWSLIDPDDHSLDPDTTQLITSTVDFLAVEVI